MEMQSPGSSVIYKCNQMESESMKSICRCCLSSDKRMYDISKYSSHFMDLAGIKVSNSDGLPHCLCYECSALLVKSVKLKHLILRAHKLLFDYSTRCVPFSIDPHDPELLKHGAPQLTATETLTFDTLASFRGGYHKTLKHNKCPIKTEICNVQQLSDPSEYLHEVKYQDSGDADLIKEEEGPSDFDDDIPLDEYKSSIEKLSEETLNTFLEDDDKLDVKEETAPVKSKKKKRKKEDKVKKKKESFTPNSELVTEDTTKMIRAPLEIDPNKIRIINLDPQEQVRQRELESRTEGYLRLPFKCKLCFKGFNFEEKLMNHMNKHNPSRGKFECTHCHMYLPTTYSYNVHMLIHTRRYECLKCGRQMIDKVSIVEHYRSQHEGIVSQYKCQLCGKISSNNKTHHGHMRNHHGGSRPVCRVCNKTFINMDSLNEHKLIHEGVKNYECPTCGQRFRTKPQVKHHQLKHTDVKEFYCVECDVRFKSEHNLRQHLQNSLKHRDVQSFKYGCVRCPKRFVSSARLQRHVAVQHDQLRAFPCQQCGAKLASQGSLNKHLKAHRGEKPEKRHVCNTCGKAFRGKSVLQNHVLTHTGEKPHACALCPRRFTQRAALRTHLALVHLKLKRGEKIKPELLNQHLNAENKTADKEISSHPTPKEEPRIVYETWRPEQVPCDIYFTVHAGP